MVYNTTISTLTAAQSLARVAASDGTITLSERKVLYESAKTDCLDSDKIIRLAYGLSNDCEQEVKIVRSNEKKSVSSKTK